MKKIHQFDEVHDAQALYRCLLKALANPLKYVEIEQFSAKLFSEYPQFLAIALTLLDNETTFACFDDQLANDIHALVLAKRMNIDEADFIFVDEDEQLMESIELARCGTLLNPQHSATIFMNTRFDQLKKIKLRGPGINGSIEGEFSEIIDKALIKRDAMAYEYPQGIDLFFINQAGQLIAIPRLSIREAV